MTTIFPSLKSSEFETEFAAVSSDIDALELLFTKHNVGRRDNPTTNAAFVSAYEEVIASLGALEERLRVVSAYIRCFTTTDANDERAKSLASLLNTRSVKIIKLNTRLSAWIGASNIESLLSQSETARDLEYSVRRAKH